MNICGLLVSTAFLPEAHTFDLQFIILCDMYAVT